MPKEYFSDRENGPRPRIIENIPLNVWNGIQIIINKWYRENAFFGVKNGLGKEFVQLLLAEVPDISWPLNKVHEEQVPVILDLIEFCFKNVEYTTKDHFNLYEQYRDSLSEREIGQDSFREDINQIFKRNGIIYELSGNGSIIRLAPEGLRELLQQTVFHTSDTGLDELLNFARVKFLDPDLNCRKDALEKLWDAWERLKTMESDNKKTSITTILEKTSPEQNFRTRLESEANELTEIGNKFRIRHHEMNKIPVDSSDHVDYLFFRMFSLIYLILKSTNRIK